jgi:signal peptidase I
MSATTDSALRPSPWRSVWLSPRATIERIVATNPRHHVLLLAALASAPTILATLVNVGLSSVLLDWRILTLALVAGPAIGIVSLYISAYFLAVVGRWFGGRASPVQLRAVIAWGAAPSALIAPILILARHSTSFVASKGLTSGYLVLIVAITLWSFVATMLMLGRVQRFGFWRTTIAYFVGATFGSVIVALLIALSVRIFLFQPFNIPSQSMMPTLLVGDYMFVSKFSYGYSHYSLPFAPPLFSGRIFASEPERGDVAVFRSPKNDTLDYIKRIVGLPNDRIQMINGVLNINGTPIQHERMDDFVWTDEKGNITTAKRWRETLPNGVSYTTLDLYNNGALDNTQVFIVPPGHYFVLGDNLDNSLDSRVPGQFGYVPSENLIGRAVVIFFSWEQIYGAKQLAIRFDRIGLTIR